MYRLMPLRYRKKVEELLVLSGSRRHANRFVNNAFAFSLAIGAGAGFLSEQAFYIVFAGVTLGVFALFHGLLVLAVERRTAFVEDILPDALQLMASNSRAGYIPSRAFIMSSRDEFGPLSEAIKRVGREMMTGEPLESALKNMNRYIRSDMLERTMNLIAEGIKSGGNFASLLEENANDIRRMSTIKKEMKANIAMYIIFILFAAAIGAPLFYSLSGFLISSLSSISGSFEVSEEAASRVNFIKFGAIDIEPAFMQMFSITALLITTIFGGLILGLISTGKERGGIKYIPMLVIIALAVYFASGIAIKIMFSSFVPGVF